MEKREKCTRSYVEAGKTHGLFHSIQLNHSFSVNHYFSFRIKQELPIVYIVISLFVSILFHFTLILLKLENALITADLLNQNPTKNVMLLYEKLF